MLRHVLAPDITPVLADHLSSLLADHEYWAHDVHIREDGDDAAVDDAQPVDAVHLKPGVHYAALLEWQHLVRPRRVPVGDRVSLDVFEDGVMVIITDGIAGADLAIKGAVRELLKGWVRQDLAQVFERLDSHGSISGMRVVLTQGKSSRQIRILRKKRYQSISGLNLPLG